MNHTHRLYNRHDDDDIDRLVQTLFNNHQNSNQSSDSESGLDQSIILS